MSKADTTENFIEKSMLIHKDTYDYSLVDYIRSMDKIKIKCKIHGVFEQTPSNHLAGKGCSKCGSMRSEAAKKLTTITFIKKAKLKHGEKYNYQLVVYINSHSKVKIVCGKHGVFEQNAGSHLVGCGCPRCKTKNISENKLLNKLIEAFPNEIIIHQAKPEWLRYFAKKNHTTQSLDIYLPKYNIAIEYQGIQHFKPIKVFKYKQGYIDCLLRDERKRKACKKVNCTLLYFTYTLKDIPENYEYTVYSLEKTLIDDIKMIIKMKKNDNYVNKTS